MALSSDCKCTASQSSLSPLASLLFFFTTNPWEISTWVMIFDNSNGIWGKKDDLLKLLKSDITGNDGDVRALTYLIICCKETGLFDNLSQSGIYR